MPRLLMVSRHSMLPADHVVVGDLLRRINVHRVDVWYLSSEHTSAHLAKQFMNSIHVALGQKDPFLEEKECEPCFSEDDVDCYRLRAGFRCLNVI
jgi:hypothetical protein